MRGVERFVQLYEQGNITEHEFSIELAMTLSEDTAAEIVDSLPADLWERARRYVEVWPHTDTGWARLRWFHMGVPSEVVPEARQAEVRRRLRHGVEMLRDL